MLLTTSLITSAYFVETAANSLVSDATTAKPLPCSFAFAASIAAFKAINLFDLKFLQ